MRTPLEHAEELLASAEADVRQLLPRRTTIVDAHVHVGRDIDGFVASYDDLIRFLGDSGASRAFCFCLDEPDREPAFRAANDRTLQAAKRSNGTLIPFARLDPSEAPLEEATRALDAGARGIKLHPRSQAFSLDDGWLGPIFALAAERSVPILIHGGRGLPPIAEQLAHLCDTHDGTQLIIAHAGVADLLGLARLLRGRPGVFFDTSVWSVLDLLELLRNVGPEQVVYASDFPYGRLPGSLFLALKSARRAGLADHQVRDLMGGTASRIADGAEPKTPTAPLDLDDGQPITLARIHHYIAMAITLLWTRQPEQIGVLGLARNTCAELHDFPAARDRAGELLQAAEDLWAALHEVEDDEERLQLERTVFSLLHMADVEALTSARS
ncbi:MAG: amidohydrolase family protein [Actinomycetia bacterium]|nr:amidohydrolase family protein [Actinomycetes bacterium]